MLPEGDINAQAVPVGHDLVAQFRAHSVEHLEFVGVFREVEFPDVLISAPDEVSSWVAIPT